MSDFSFVGSAENTALAELARLEYHNEIDPAEMIVNLRFSPMFQILLTELRHRYGVRLKDDFHVLLFAARLYTAGTMDGEKHEYRG